MPETRTRMLRINGYNKLFLPFHFHLFMLSEHGYNDITLIANNIFTFSIHFHLFF